MEAIVFIKDYSNKKEGQRSSNFARPEALRLIALGVAVFEKDYDKQKEKPTKKNKVNG